MYSLFQLSVCGMLFSYWCLKEEREKDQSSSISFDLQTSYRCPTEDVESLCSKFKTADSIVFLNYFSQNIKK